jgi:hypothetical protein
MTTQPIEAPATVHITADKLRHVYCMAHGIPTTGMCGAPRNVALGIMGPIATVARPPHMCIVCEDLMFAPCPNCEEY